MELGDILTTVSGHPITVENVLTHLKTTGTFRNAIHALIESQVISQTAAELGVEVEDDELHEFVAQRRSALGLSDVVAVNEYCRWMGITFDQWHAALESELLRLKLMHEMIDDATVTAYFEEHSSALKSVAVSRLVCADQEQVESLVRRAGSGQEEFTTLAREYSIEENTRVAGGYVGTIKMGMLPAEIDDAIFSAPPDTIVGPFCQNGYWVLYKIDNVEYAGLDGALRQRITETLFNDWLAQQVHDARP